MLISFYQAIIGEVIMGFKLHHEHVVSTYGIIKDHGGSLKFLVLPWVEHKSAVHYIDDQFPEGVLESPEIVPKSRKFSCLINQLARQDSLRYR